MHYICIYIYIYVYIYICINKLGHSPPSLHFHHIFEIHIVASVIQRKFTFITKVYQKK